MSDQETNAGLGLVEIELDVSSVISFAGTQNSIPILRRVSIEHSGQEPLNNLVLEIACSPAWAAPIRLAIDVLAPGAQLQLTKSELTADPTFLRSLEESTRSNVVATLTQGDCVLSSATAQVELLAWNEWSGTRALPELLAAFVTPNAPGVASVMLDAARMLQRLNPPANLEGYSQGDKQRVWSQISAIFSAIAGKQVAYALPPASFERSGQKIRSASQILETRLSTCLDTAVLVASCLEQAGLNPVLLVKKGHAWVGCWLENTGFATAVMDDLQAIRKYVDSHQLLVLEATNLNEGYNARLSHAVDLGKAYLIEDTEFEFAIDVAAARKHRIKPISVGGVEPPGKDVPTGGVEPPGIEAPPHFTESGEDAPIVPVGTDSRLQLWKSKLLDLTLRNRLLNFKPAKSNLRLVTDNPAAIEDMLSSGESLKVLPRPKLMEDDDPRSKELHRQRSGREALIDYAADALNSKVLVVEADEDALDARLLEIRGAAKTGLEEGGANTLFLAIGLLQWNDEQAPEKRYLSPILLVPIVIERKSARSPYTISRHDDETVVNPTLIEALRTRFDLEVPGIDPLPKDEQGVDVQGVFQRFRLAVQAIRGWEVLEQTHIGIFSFSKYLMWTDLQSRLEDLKNNPVVAHLVDHPQEPFNGPAQSPRTQERLDRAYAPHEILTPRMADSSQLAAICRAHEGEHLVIKGPPGTGKSETITNLIANFLGQGKKVLFVSEKMAALEVVQRRLGEIGLSPFCLELHSSKAKKAEVVAQLGAALDEAGKHDIAQWARQAEDLAAKRHELNDLVDALHHTHVSGLTVFGCIGAAVSHDHWQPARMPWTDPQTHDEVALDALRDLTRRIAALAGEVGQVKGHPFSLIESPTWTPSWQERVFQARDEVVSAGEALIDRAKTIARVLGMDTFGYSQRELAALDPLLEHLLVGANVPAGVVKASQDATAMAQLASLARHGAARNGVWAEFKGALKPEVARINGSELEAQWQLAVSTWWPKSWFAKRPILRRLKLVVTSPEAITPDRVEGLLSTLIELNREDGVLATLAPEGERLLGDSYKGLETDWQAAVRHCKWGEELSELITGLVGDAVQTHQALEARALLLAVSHRRDLAPVGQIANSLLEFRAARSKFIELTAEIEQLANLRNLWPDALTPGWPQGVLAQLAGWVGQGARLPAWCRWRGVRKQAQDKGLVSVVDALEAGSVPLAEVPAFFEFSYRTWWLAKIVDQTPLLCDFSSADHQRKIEDFRGADAAFAELTKRYIFARIAGQVPESNSLLPSGDTEVGKLRRELTRRRGHEPIRKLFSEIPTLLPRLKPCLLMSPLSVAQYLDASQNAFDVVMFDEASQIPVWDAVGAIARGKQLICVGDPKQLPPTSFFNRTSDVEDEATTVDVADQESILDECMAAGLPTVGLKWHYRSRHEGLITFSNHAYYDNSLITFPSPVTDDGSVEFVRVNGVYDRGGSRTNRGEAEAIVAGIEQHFLKSAHRTKSLGVVTFNQPQQMLIENLLEARRRANPELDRAILAASREELFVKNLENVQGDERDFIYFSITYGRDAAGRDSMNFGPLNQDGGQRRLNVAITRAREQVRIFSSLLPEHIDLARVNAAGVRDLKHYLEFALRGARAIAEQALPTGRDVDSPFEAQVMRALRDKGWTVHPQVGCSGYRIDLGIVDPNAPGRYLAGVECDGAMYHSAATARDRDRLRHMVLEGLGWNLLRIWSTDWWIDSQGQAEKVHERLCGLRDAPPQEPEIAPVVEIDPPVAEDPVQTPVGPVDQPGPSSAPVPPPQAPAYRQAMLTSQAHRDFYDTACGRFLIEDMQSVTSIEGPIIEKALFDRVARAWNLLRTGSRISERLRTVSVGRIPFVDEANGQRFYWPQGVDPQNWSGFRVADDTPESRRNVSDVSQQELSNLIEHLLRNEGATSRAEIARSVSRLLGTDRTSAQAQARIDAVVDTLTATQRIRSLTVAGQERVALA
jgi:very-short-patch-repair endonuclease